MFQVRLMEVVRVATTPTATLPAATATYINIAHTTAVSVTAAPTRRRTPTTPTRRRQETPSTGE